MIFVEEPLGGMLSSYLPRIDGFAVHIKAIALQGRPGASGAGLMRLNQSCAPVSSLPRVVCVCVCEVALWLAGSLLYVQKLNHSDVLTPPCFICAWAVTMMTCVHISYVSESRVCAPGLWVDVLGDLTRSTCGESATHTMST